MNSQKVGGNPGFDPQRAKTVGNRTPRPAPPLGARCLEAVNASSRNKNVLSLLADGNCVNEQNDRAMGLSYWSPV